MLCSPSPGCGWSSSNCEYMGELVSALHSRGVNVYVLRHTHVHSPVCACSSCEHTCAHATLSPARLLARSSSAAARTPAATCGTPSWAALARLHLPRLCGTPTTMVCRASVTLLPSVAGGRLPSSSTPALAPCAALAWTPTTTLKYASHVSSRLRAPIQCQCARSML